MISIITAVDENNLIGNDDKLPWFIPEDLRYFKQTTLNHPIVMGRKTYESVGYLPLRENIILTKNSHNVDIKNGSMICTRTFDEFIGRYNRSLYTDREVFIIGGREIYSLFLPYVDKLYITQIKGKYKGNVYFPKYNLAKHDLSQYGFKYVSIKENNSCDFKIYIKNIKNYEKY